MVTSQEHDHMRLASLTRDLEALEVVRRQHPILEWQDFDAVPIHSACNEMQNEVAVPEWNMTRLIDSVNRTTKLARRIASRRVRCLPMPTAASAFSLLLIVCLGAPASAQTNLW